MPYDPPEHLFEATRNLQAEYSKATRRYQPPPWSELRTAVLGLRTAYEHMATDAAGSTSSRGLSFLGYTVTLSSSSSSSSSSSGKPLDQHRLDQIECLIQVANALPAEPPPESAVQVHNILLGACFDRYFRLRHDHKRPYNCRVYQLLEKVLHIRFPGEEGTPNIPDYMSIVTDLRAFENHLVQRRTDGALYAYFKKYPGNLPEIEGMIRNIETGASVRSMARLGPVFWAGCGLHGVSGKMQPYRDQLFAWHLNQFLYSICLQVTEAYKRYESAVSLLAATLATKVDPEGNLTAEAGRQCIQDLSCDPGVRHILQFSYAGAIGGQEVYAYHAEQCTTALLQWGKIQFLEMLTGAYVLAMSQVSTGSRIRDHDLYNEHIKALEITEANNLFGVEPRSVESRERALKAFRNFYNALPPDAPVMVQAFGDREAVEVEAKRLSLRASPALLWGGGPTTAIYTHFQPVPPVSSSTSSSYACSSSSGCTGSMPGGTG